MAAPTVSALPSSVDQNGWARFSSMFTATDSDGFITQYEFFDNTTVAGSSYFWVNGATPVSSLANPITVSAADLATVWLHGGTSIGGNDALLVRAYDNSGLVSEYIPILLTTQAPSVGANIIRGGSGDDVLSGTPGDDQIFGNDGNDMLNGIAGNDFLDGGNGLDTARFSGLMSSYTITRAGTSGTLTGPDGTDSFSSVERLQFDDQSLALLVPKDNFNGDLTGDLLWRNNDGTVGIWSMQDATHHTTDVVQIIPTDWHISGTGDFNGDGKSDLIWRANDGTVGIWTMQDATHHTTDVIQVIPNDWHIMGTPDVNGDGKSDVVWRADDGTVGIWSMQDATHHTTDLPAVIPTDWVIA